MPNKPRIGITLLTALIAFLAPALASAYLVWWESYATEKTLSLNYAQDVLRRMEEISTQFTAGAHTLADAGLAPCSPQDIKLMRQLDLGSSYMKGVGRIAHDTLLCTSQGAQIPISLGEPDLVTAQGISYYFNKNLGSQPSHPLSVFAIDGFAMIVDPCLATDVSTEGPDVELAVFVPSDSGHDRIAAHGQEFPAAWFDPIGQGAQSTILNNDYLVSESVRRSGTWPLWPQLRRIISINASDTSHSSSSPSVSSAASSFLC